MPQSGIRMQRHMQERGQRQDEADTEEKSGN